MRELIINCDGGSRGNPGPGAAAFVAKVGSEEIYENSKYLGVTTNNVAEYEAVILALEWLTKEKNLSDISSIKFYLDSELIVKQIKGLYKVKNDRLKKLKEKVFVFLKMIKTKIIFENVLREENKTADKMVNVELDKNV